MGAAVSLCGPAPTNRAQEKNRAASVEMTGYHLITKRLFQETDIIGAREADSGDRDDDQCSGGGCADH